jgi:hypothetical protein
MRFMKVEDSSRVDEQKERVVRGVGEFVVFLRCYMRYYQVTTSRD